MTQPIDPRVLKRIEKKAFEYAPFEIVKGIDIGTSSRFGYKHGSHDEATRAQKLVEHLKGECYCGAEGVSENIACDHCLALNEYFGGGEDV